MSTLVWNTNARLVPGYEDKTILFNNESGWQGKISGVALGLLRQMQTLGSFTRQELSKYPGALIGFLLDKRVLLQESEVAEYYQTVNQHIETSLTDAWQLIVLPTERCNFACPYCYEERVKGKMKPAIAEATEKCVIRMAQNAPAFKLSFFGGEPLLAPDLVLRFAKAAYENAAVEKGYTSEITTNGGLLTPKLISELGKYKLRGYQITIDGPRKIHDMQRPTKGGKGTFDVVLNAFDQLYHSDVEGLRVSMRINVHPHIAQSYLPLLDEPIIQKVLSDKRFNLNLHEIWGSEKYVLPLVEDADSARQTWREVQRTFSTTLGTWKQTSSRQFLNTTCGDACYAGKKNQFVLYPTGDVGKCTVILEDERNYIGKLRMDGSLELNEAKHDFWIGRNALVDKDCQKCAYRVTCAGIGCPLGRVKPGDGTCSLRDNYDLMWGRAIAC